jgi:hypothetical protein
VGTATSTVGRWRRTTLREEHGRGADAEGEEQVRAERVAEVELGHAQGEIVLAITEHALRVEHGGVEEARVALHHRLGAPRGAAREEPDRSVVAVGVEGRVALALAREARLERALVARIRAAHQQPHARRRHAAEGVELLRVDHRDSRARVGEEVLDLVGAELRVHHHHGGAALERAEHRPHEVRHVGERDEHALFRA